MSYNLGPYLRYVDCILWEFYIQLYFPEKSGFLFVGVILAGS